MTQIKSPASAARRRSLISIRRLCQLGIIGLGVVVFLSILNFSRLYTTHGSTASSPLSVKSSNPPNKQQGRDPSCKFSVRSIEDLRECYPPELVRPLPEDCQRITEWNDVQRCLNGRYDDYDHMDGQEGDSANPVSRSRHFDISLIGERNSGTKFLTKELQRCFRSLSQSSNATRNNNFPDVTVKIHRDFQRHKHFFQPLFLGNHRQRIVVALFRDPVEWVAAMHQSPYHAPHHVAGFTTTKGGESIVIPLPWSEFVSRPWTTPRSPKDLEILADSARMAETLKGETCLYRYSIYDVVPCMWDNATTNYPTIPDDILRGYVPVYELHRDHSMRPFDSILELRFEKIINFLMEVPLLYRTLGGYAAIRYEDLLQHGTRHVLEQVAEMIGLSQLPNDCQSTGPQPERLGKRYIPKDMRKWILEHIDPKLERLLGYGKDGRT